MRRAGTEQHPARESGGGEVSEGFAPGYGVAGLPPAEQSTPGTRAILWVGVNSKKSCRIPRAGVRSGGGSVQGGRIQGLLSVQ